MLEEEAASRSMIPKKDHDPVRGIIDVAHDQDLGVSLLYVILVDADCVDPEQTSSAWVPEGTKSVVTIPSDRKLCIAGTAKYFDQLSGVAPCVRQSLEGAFRGTEIRMAEAEVDIWVIGGAGLQLEEPHGIARSETEPVRRRHAPRPSKLCRRLTQSAKQEESRTWSLARVEIPLKNWEMEHLRQHHLRADDISQKICSRYNGSDWLAYALLQPMLIFSHCWLSRMTGIRPDGLCCFLYPSRDQTRTITSIRRRLTRADSRMTARVLR